MINEAMQALGQEQSAIRELFDYGVKRKQEIGAENVYDFSIGNPSVPAPATVAKTIARLIEGEPAALHAYSSASGYENVRAAIAENLNKRFDTHYTAANLYLTAGASASLACCFRAISHPGDEIIVIAPFFPEYKVHIECGGAKMVPVHAREDNFQIDLDALAAAINERTVAVTINSPNNPVGVVYTRETLEGLADLLRTKEEELGHPIYLVSDEPYRELTYGAEVPWIPSMYANTLVCYSWSKSLSLPGERIGYVLVPDTMPNSKEVYAAVAGAGRSLGYICAPVLFQFVIAECVDEPADVAAYAQNRQDFTAILDELGYEYIEPDGAFYLWIKALEPDAKAFSTRAKEECELLLVPSDSFGVEGWVRAGYCIPNEVIKASRDAFAKLMDSYK